MQPMYYIGLDVHKRKISYCVKDGSGRIHAEGSVSATRLDRDHWMRALPQPWSAAMEVTMFTGWIYDHLKPHAAVLKVAHPLMLRPLPPQRKKTTASTPARFATACGAFFAGEPHGLDGDSRTAAHAALKPIGRWKEAWESAKARSGVACRFHDLRHTGCTRMREAGVPFSVVATIMGWSPSTTVRMSKRYGHIGDPAKRRAVDALYRAESGGDGAQKWAQLQKPRLPQLAN